MCSDRAVGVQIIHGEGCKITAPSTVKVHESTTTSRGHDRELPQVESPFFACDVIADITHSDRQRPAPGKGVLCSAKKRPFLVVHNNPLPGWVSEDAVQLDSWRRDPRILFAKHAMNTVRTGKPVTPVCSLACFSFHFLYLTAFFFFGGVQRLRVVLHLKCSRLRTAQTLW